MTGGIALVLLLVIPACLLAKETSSTSIPPELTTLKRAYGNAVEEKRRDLDGKLSALASRYEEALQKLARVHKEAGNLVPLLAVRREKDRFLVSKTVLEGDPVSGLAELRELQVKFRRAHALYEDQYAEQCISLTKYYLQRLSELQKKLTRLDKIEDALAVAVEIRLSQNGNELRLAGLPRSSKARDSVVLAHSIHAQDYMLEFDGRTTVVQIPDCKDLSGGQGKSITVEAWVKPYATDPHPKSTGIINKVLDSEWKDYAVYCRRRDSRICVKIDNNDDNWVIEGTSIPMEELSHIAFVFDNAGNKGRVMVNGRTVAEKRRTRDCPDTLAPLRIGSVYFRGLIDEVRISNIARYESDFVPKRRHTRDENTVLLLHFDEGSGGAIVDSSGRGHHGVVLGAKAKWIKADWPDSQVARSADGSVSSDVSGRPTAPDATLRLSANWNLPGLKGGSLITKELEGMLKEHGSPNVDLSAHPNMVLYRNVRYLMPLKQAVESLGLKRVASRNTVTTAGFPRSSFFYHKYDGDFGMGANKLLLVTDQADQVVAVQLVIEAPKRRRMKGHSHKRGLYNVIQMRRKGSASWAVARRSHYQNGVLRLDHEVIDKRGAPREFVCLLFPKPMIGLVLYSIRKNREM